MTDVLTSIARFTPGMLRSRYQGVPLIHYLPSAVPFLTRCSIVPHLWQNEVLCTRQQAAADRGDTITINFRITTVSLHTH